MVSQTSIEAYQCKNTQATFSGQKHTILEWMQHLGAPCTMNEISRMTGIRINAVCGRVRELEKERAIKHVGYKRDAQTFKKNKTYTKR